MTEPSSLLTTHPASNAYPIAALAPSVSPVLNGTLSDSHVPEEEEYTIKCICVFTDDDGNTVYCPKCDTWQHIECYYHGKKVPEDHFCADCDPSRELDHKKATERQRRAREQVEGGDRKVRRPALKSQKKKHKDIVITENTNGWNNHERHDSIVNGRDQPPPAKKTKTSHRASGSIVSLNGESRKRAHSNLQSYPSPSRSPQETYRSPIIPQYTAEFLELYDRDDGETHANSNEYTISALPVVSAWRSEPSLTVNGVDQQPNDRSPFVHTDQDFDDVKWPRVSIESTQNNEVEVDGRNPIWKFLRLQTDVSKNSLVGEIRGQVGTLDEYCHQQSCQNRWSELTHPDPFVFFHPHMNIYIDSRKSGTQFRYLRRSCNPNVTLRTFIVKEEQHHCFVANKAIPAGSELTAAWYIDRSMLDLTNGREDTEQLHNQRCDWISRVLANFGDCACDHSNCPWDKYDRRSPLKAIDAPTKQSSVRKKKGKAKAAISPMSTGQATNSRAGSETVKPQEDEDQFDRRSTSESSRSGVHSRDLTPVNVAALDADPILGSDLTARDIRKIQAAEKAFEKKKQVHSDKKKKKRTSGGSTVNTPGVGVSKQLGHSLDHIDGKHSFGSPPPPRALKDVSNQAATPTQRPEKTVRPIYITKSVQTDPEDCEIITPSPKRRKFSTPTQRLLRRVLRDRALLGIQPCTAGSTRPDILDAGKRVESPRDLKMHDAASGMSPTSPPLMLKSPTEMTLTENTTALKMSPSYPFPSQAAHTIKVHDSFKPPPAPKLNLSSLPPVPSFQNASVGTPGSSIGTPTSTTIAMQSPSLFASSLSAFPGTIGNVSTPSPAKKKLSLGDYMSRRNASATPTTEKPLSKLEPGTDLDGPHSAIDTYTQSESLLSKPNGSVFQAAVQNGVVDEDAVEDLVMQDEDEPEYNPPESTPPVDDSRLARDNSADVPVEIANVSSNLAYTQTKQEDPPIQAAQM